MKIRKILTATAFVLAVGSAFASRQLAQPGFTSKQDVPEQAENCEERGECSGTGSPCVIILNPGPSQVTVPLYDGVQNENAICGTQLRHS